MAMSIILAWDGSVVGTLSWFPLYLVLIAPAFAFHELGHKFAAQKYGFHAEYRMWRQGLFFAAALALISNGNFTFIAPGAVYFGGRQGSDAQVGKIGFAGPLVNLILAAGFGMAGVLTGNGLLMLGAYINSFIALFNLIPFPPFDGQKIMAWNKLYWAMALGLGIVLFVMSSG
ncbi:MAG: hypothetical protein ABIG20_01325 [archaeon]